MGRFPVSLETEQALMRRMESLGIEERDLEESFIRGSGSGGQKINKTSVCVVLRHVPTGFEVRCQKERSQALNRFFARRELCEKIESSVLREKSRVQQERERIRRQKRKRSKRAKEKLLRDKAKRSELKSLRKKVVSSGE